MPLNATLAASARKRIFWRTTGQPAITSLLETTPLTVDYSAQHREFVIRDRQAGQSLLPRKDVQGNFRDSYQVVVRCTFNNKLLLTHDYYAHRLVKR